MGAVAALMYMNSYKNDPLIKALILDSPYASLKDVLLYIGNKKSFFPEFLISWGISSVNSET